MRQIQTAKIRAKGWTLRSALERWGRSTDWYHRQTKGDEKVQQRLEDMIEGLPVVER